MSKSVWQFHLPQMEIGKNGRIDGISAASPQLREDLGKLLDPGMVTEVVPKE